MEFLFRAFPRRSAQFLCCMVSWGLLWGVGISWMIIHKLLVPYYSTFSTFREASILLLAALRVIMFVLQIPVRLSILYKLFRTHTIQEHDAVAAKLMEMNNSVLWQYNHHFGMLLMIWTGFSTIVALHPSLADNPIAGDLMDVCVVNIAIVAFNLLSATLWLKNILDNVPVGGVTGGASEPLISMVTTVVGSTHSSLGDDPICAVCLAEYAPEDQIRLLGCGHAYHKTCVDVWLFKRKSCPLCNANIDSSTCKRKLD